MFKTDPRRSYMMPAHFGAKYMGSKTSGWYRDVTMMVVPYLTDRDQLAETLAGITSSRRWRAVQRLRIPRSKTRSRS